MNKKGQGFYGVIFVIVLLAVILILGFIAVIGSSVLNFVGDEIVPELSGLGDVGGVNITNAAEYTIQPANTFIQSFTWITGVLYVLMLLGSIGIAYSVRVNPSGWLIGLYFFLVLVLIALSIFISNMYQDIYNTSDDFGGIVREHGLMSYMILYAPMIYAIMGFIAGFIMFSGRQMEEGGYV